jgi:hypothetical protein
MTQPSGDKLSFPAMLNVMADEQATRQRNLMNRPNADVKNNARVQLQIANVAITRDSQQWILKSAGRIPIEQYYREKFQWTKQTFDSINWEVQHKVLKSFTPADQTRIVKFIHGWLPTQKRLHMEGEASSPRCPLCKDLLEDNLHLLCCSHERMKEVQKKIPQFLEKSLHDYGNSEIWNILEVGLESSTAGEWTADIKFVSPEWKEAIKEQNEIGWVHMYKGRIGNKLLQAVAEHYKELGLNQMSYNGERWAKKLITNIWKTILELWSTRLEILHDTDKVGKERLRKEKLKTRIQRCYEYSDRLLANERQKWFSKDIEDVLQQDAKYLETWLQLVERIIRIAKREQKNRPLESKIMERFLNIGEQSINTQRQQQRNPRSLAQDMNPD